MNGHKSKWNSSVVVILVLLIVIPCLSWKPIVTLAWRFRNPVTASLVNRSLTVPWPWMVTRTGESVKLRAFATQWPAVNNAYATALISMSSSSDMSLSNSEWLSQSKSRYESHGFRDVKEVPFDANGVFCAEATSDKTESDYCRSKQGYDITFIGPHALLVGLVSNLSSDK
jgi:hypothetical protein